MMTSKVKKRDALNSYRKELSQGASSKNGNKAYIWKSLLVVILAILCGVIHGKHAAEMFERSTHFSHLADFEREMLFRTEMGFYYSFYKYLVNAKSFKEGLIALTRDNQTEYGREINALKRFNLYPEIIISAMYRVFKSITKYWKIPTQICWQVKRDVHLPPVTSCEGIGNQMFFYIYMVYFLAGLVGSLLFLYGFLLSDSIFGGLFTVLCFFYNHSEATRVQWTPPLRESFGYPAFLCITLLISKDLKYKSTLHNYILISLSSVMFMLVWQFASIALATVVGSLVALNMLGLISNIHLKQFFKTFFVSILIACFMLFKNEMLLSSLFFASLIAVKIMLYVEQLLLKGCFFKLANFSKPFTFAFGVVCVKFFIGKLLRTEDDAHIFDLLRAKIFGLHTFDTLLYTCAAEFDFLPFEYFKKTSATLLLPMAFVICISGVYILFFKQLLKDNKTSKPISSSTAMIIFNMIQLACFALMAGMIMRLKLFLTPQMCIIVSLLFSEKFLCDIVGFQVKKRWFFAACIALLSCMSVAGIRNINEERNIIGEFENADMENLFDWINTRTLPNAVFACSIPLSANLKLTTERPIVIHPHYEDTELRKRTKQVYEMYSRRSPEKFIQALQKLHVNYLIIENWVCLKDSKDNCSQTDIWDYVDAKSRGQSESICRRLLADDQKFLPVVYSHGGYFVFKVQ
ncbi:C-mannosyltransferase dpy-19 [Trichinella britovi]|uniref:C-mannosyltransferase dpy-19 n=1 Tax=Trichinella britovi TaxID=45882 RepID=A0A0V1D6P1_TRIBR|nr:C-mannosyltransferase dpy-19 [Trichinella britovi]